MKNKLFVIWVAAFLISLMVASCTTPPSLRRLMTPVSPTKDINVEKVDEATMAPEPTEALEPTMAPEPTLEVIESSPTVESVDGLKLLFVWGTGCTHSAYEKPIITEFQTAHPEVQVTWVNSSELSSEQQQLVAGTSGTPVMVFYSGAYIRQYMGEADLQTLETELVNLQAQITASDQTTTTTGSYWI